MPGRLAALRDGAAAAGRSRPVRLVVRVYAAVTADPVPAREGVRRELVEYLASPPYARWFRSIGFRHEVDAVAAAFAARDRAASVAAVSDRMVDDMLVAGDASAVLDRLAAYAAAGADDVMVQPVPPERGGEVAATIAALAHERPRTAFRIGVAAGRRDRPRQHGGADGRSARRRRGAGRGVEPFGRARRRLRRPRGGGGGDARGRGGAARSWSSRSATTWRSARCFWAMAASCRRRAPAPVVVDTSTVHPATAAAMAEACAARSVDFVDAPVSGGIEGAANGTLTLFCGGSAEAVAKARPVLEQLGRRIEHLGPTGAGQVTKAVNQVVLAGNYLGVAEGIAMAEAAGLDPSVVVAAIEQGAAASWVLSNRAANMVARDFPSAGRLALHLKDLGIALALARDAGKLLPVATLVAGIEQVLAAADYGDEDVSCVIRYLRPGGGPSGHEPRPSPSD